MKWIRINGCLLLICLLEMLLMAVGIFFEPSINFMSIIGIFLVPILTFVLLYVFKKNVHEKAIFLFSLLLVVLYFVEISLEYLIQPASTEVFGIVEYGLVAALCVITAIYFSLKTKKLSLTIKATSIVFLLGSIGWVINNFGFLYLLTNTAAQNNVLIADGTYLDYIASGAGKVYRAFVIEDYVGGAFFHTFLFLILDVVLTLGIYGIVHLVTSNKKHKYGI